LPFGGIRRYKGIEMTSPIDPNGQQEALRKEMIGRIEEEVAARKLADRGVLWGTNRALHHIYRLLGQLAQASRSGQPLDQAVVDEITGSLETYPEWLREEDHDLLEQLREQK
jgi:hypothetical protein